MKKQLLILASACLLLASCNEIQSSSSSQDSEPIDASSDVSSKISSTETLIDSSEDSSISSSTSESDSYYIEILPTSIEATSSQQYLFDYNFSVFDALNKEYKFFGTSIQRGGGDHANTIQCSGSDKRPYGAISSLEPLKGTARITQLDTGTHTGTPIFEVGGEAVETEPTTVDGKITYTFPIDGIFSFRVKPGNAIYLYSLEFFN